MGGHSTGFFYRAVCVPNFCRSSRSSCSARKPEPLCARRHPLRLTSNQVKDPLRSRSQGGSKCDAPCLFVFVLCDAHQRYRYGCAPELLTIPRTQRSCSVETELNSTQCCQTPRGRRGVCLRVRPAHCVQLSPCFDCARPVVRMNIFQSSIAMILQVSYCAWDWFVDNIELFGSHVLSWTQSNMLFFSTMWCPLISSTRSLCAASTLAMTTSDWPTISVRRLFTLNSRNMNCEAVTFSEDVKWTFSV